MTEKHEFENYPPSNFSQIPREIKELKFFSKLFTLGGRGLVAFQDLGLELATLGSSHSVAYPAVFELT